MVLWFAKRGLNQILSKHRKISTIDYQLKAPDY